MTNKPEITLRRAECCYNCDHSTCVRYSSWSTCDLKKNDEDNTVYWHQVCDHFSLRQEEQPPTN